MRIDDFLQIFPDGENVLILLITHPVSDTRVFCKKGTFDICCDHVDKKNDKKCITFYPSPGLSNKGSLGILVGGFEETCPENPGDHGY